MKITSPDFGHAEEIPRKFTAEGENVNPSLQVSEVPMGTKTLALLMEDPDVPTNLVPSGLWTHWLIWNMPPDTEKILSGTVPPGFTWPNSAGNHSYGGPNPPNGRHRYFFRLFALDSELEIPNETRRDGFLGAIEGHVIEEAQLVGTYVRSDYVGE